MRGKLRSVRWLLVLLLPACSGRCGGSPVPVTPDVTAQQPMPAGAAPADAAGALEARWHIRLPQRLQDKTLPALAHLPRKRLERFDPERDLWLVVRTGPSIEFATGAALSSVELADDASLTVALRSAAGEWSKRAGVAATTLRVAADREVAGTELGRIKRLALQAHPWRITLVVRDGEELAELMLNNPPAARVQALPGAPTPSQPADQPAH